MQYVTRQFNLLEHLSVRLSGVIIRSTSVDKTLRRRTCSSYIMYVCYAPESDFGDKCLCRNSVT